MTKNSDEFTAPNTATGTGINVARPASSEVVFVWAWALEGEFLTPLRVLSFAVLVGSEPMDGRPL